MVSQVSPQFTDAREARSDTLSGTRSDTLPEVQVDRMFRALADATRRDIVRRTLAAEASISELASAYDMSFAAVQKHVAVLEAADLVARTPKGRERIIRGNPETIRRAQELLGHFEQIWRSRIDRLDAFLAERPH